MSALLHFSTYSDFNCLLTIALLMFQVCSEKSRHLHCLCDTSSSCCYHLHCSVPHYLPGGDTRQKGLEQVPKDLLAPGGDSHLSRISAWHLLAHRPSPSSSDILLNGTTVHLCCSANPDWNPYICVPRSAQEGLPAARLQDSQATTHPDDDDRGGFKKTDGNDKHKRRISCGL